MPKSRKPSEPATKIAKPSPCTAMLIMGSSHCGEPLVGMNDDGEIANHDKEGVAYWICESGHRVEADDRCPSDGAPLTFNPDTVGKTCGGLMLRGWNHCDNCGGIWLTRKGVPFHGAADDGRWSVATSGMSIDIGELRLRVDGKGKKKGDTHALMQRIARVPAMEAALRAIAELTGEDGARARQLAREALAVDGTGDDQDNAPGAEDE